MYDIAFLRFIDSLNPSFGQGKRFVYCNLTFIKESIYRT